LHSKAASGGGSQRGAGKVLPKMTPISSGVDSWKVLMNDAIAEKANQSIS
jgi:hypothetical protein